MTGAPFRPPPPRRRPLRRWAAASALAVALSTLAGGEPARWPADDAPAPRAAATGAVAATDHRPTGPRPRAGALHRRAGAEQPAPMRTAGAQPADPHPHAPGGDDLLPWDTGSSTPQKSPSAADPSTSRNVAGAAPLRTTVQAGPAVAASLQPASSLLLWLERPRVRLGEPVVLHLVRNGVGECRGLDALQGQGLLGDRVMVQATAAGRHRLTVRCQGPGGPLERAATLVVPVPVYASSAENRRRSDLDPARVPSLRQLGLPEAPGEDGAEVRTPGDFLQEGRLSLFVAAAGADGPATVHLLARDESGRWRDRSADWLAGADRRGCRRPVQALTADFNHDQLPDVYLACHDGDAQLLFISQPDGRYRRVELALGLPAQQAEAADVDQDGEVDIVTVALAGDSPHTLVLRGRGDGSFVVDERPGAVALRRPMTANSANAADSTQGRR